MFIIVLKKLLYINSIVFLMSQRNPSGTGDGDEFVKNDSKIHRGLRNCDGFNR